MRIAALGDIHCTSKSEGLFEPLFCKIASLADVLVLCGDLTDYGTLEEARTLARELRLVTMTIPVLAVLGNHDHEAGQQEELMRVLREHGVYVLDGQATVIGDVGFAGTKGFGGGFGRRLLNAFGEEAIKRFVQESTVEARKLETALSTLQTPYRIAVTHYAPIVDTTAPEPAELYAFLGSSHLEDVIDQNEVTAAFHGHAHYGSPQGSTSSGVPVYNVALPLLRRHLQGQLPVRIIEVGHTTVPKPDSVTSCPPSVPREVEAPPPAVQAID